MFRWSLKTLWKENFFWTDMFCSALPKHPVCKSCVCNSSTREVGRGAVLGLSAPCLTCDIWFTKVWFDWRLAGLEAACGSAKGQWGEGWGRGA